MEEQIKSGINLNRRFDDLSDADRLALTSADIEREIELRMVERGKKLPEPPVLKEEPDAVSESVELFTCAIFSGIGFRSHADVLSAMHAIEELCPVRICPEWSPRGEVARMYRGGDEPVVRKLVFSEEDYESSKGDLERRSAVRNHNESESNRYGHELREYRKVAAVVHGEMDELREREGVFQRRLSQLRRYVDLADGDRAAAVKFYEAALLETGEFTGEDDEALFALIDRLVRGLDQE